jgi:hypothetical protein
MTDTPGAKALTEALLTVIRQQQHYGARVIISTHERTILPRLIDLCSVTVVHRFTSPQWYAVLWRHISAGGYYDGDDDASDDGNGGNYHKGSVRGSTYGYDDSSDANLYTEQDSGCGGRHRSNSGGKALVYAYSGAADWRSASLCAERDCRR